MITTPSLFLTTQWWPLHHHLTCHITMLATTSPSWKKCTYLFSFSFKKKTHSFSLGNHFPLLISLKSHLKILRTHKNLLKIFSFFLPYAINISHSLWILGYRCPSLQNSGLYISCIMLQWKLVLHEFTTWSCVHITPKWRNTLEWIEVYREGLLRKEINTTKNHSRRLTLVINCKLDHHYLIISFLVLAY